MLLSTGNTIMSRIKTIILYLNTIYLSSLAIEKDLCQATFHLGAWQDSIRDSVLYNIGNKIPLTQQGKTMREIISSY